MRTRARDTRMDVCYPSDDRWLRVNRWYLFFIKFHNTEMSTPEDILYRPYPRRIICWLLNF